jgi:2-methylcitrate dehydratase PrpD
MTMETNREDGNQLAAAFILDFKLEFAPLDVRRRAKVCLLDLVGACLAGARSNGAEILMRFCLSQFAGPPEATVIRAGRKLSCSAASLVNGFIANALDIDDGYRPVKGHPGAAVFPAVLAIAEKVGATGRQFLEALIVAYEIAMRAGLAIQAHYGYYHSSGAWGAIGSAAGAARLLGLSPTQTQRALGIAEFYAPLTPVMRAVRHPAMPKDGTAWGAMTGTTAALLAGDGYTASPSLLGDPACEPEMLGLGKEYKLLKLYFKPYPCCRWAQPAVDATLQLISRHDIRPDAISQIEILTFPEAAALSQEPPSDLEQAEYNICYPVAVAAVHGAFGPVHLEATSFSNQRVLAMMEKIRVVVDADIQARFPEKCLSAVKITTCEGTVHHSGVMSARGDWDNPLSETELEKKFITITRHVLSDGKARTLIDRVTNIESHTVADLTTYLE